MSSTAIDVRELPRRFAELVARAAAGDEVIITDGTAPRARLVALPQGRERRPGLHPAAITTTTDFDDSLPDEVWTGGP